MGTPVETLAVMLQRAKTHMEKTSLSTEFNVAYRELSGTLLRFEDSAAVDAPALRDAEDNHDGDQVTWECPKCGAPPRWIWTPSRRFHCSPSA